MVLKPISRILTQLERLSDDQLFNLAAVFRVMWAILLFALIVVVWDTLPSKAPISNVKLTTTTAPNMVRASYTYRVQKVVPYTLEYTLTNAQSGQTLYEKEMCRPDAIDLVKVFIVQPGKWCLDTKISWNNGFSLKTHHDQVPTACFDI